MLLGDVIARLEDDACAEETLLAMDDLALLAQVTAAAAAAGLTRGEYMAAAIGNFAAASSDEEWVTVIGQMGRVDNPGQVLLRRAIVVALQNMAPRSCDHAAGDGGCRCGG